MLKGKLLSTNLAILLAYFFLACVVTFPLIFNLTTSIYGYPSDSFYVVWSMWWFRHAWQNHLPSDFMPLADAPWGRWFNTATFQPLLALMLKGFAVVFGGGLGYNLLLLLSFTLTAWAVYLLIKYLTKLGTAGFVSGCVVGFSLYMQWHGLQNIELVMWWWVPLTVLFLIKTLRERSLVNPFLTALFFTAAFFTSFYNGYFLGIFVLGFLVFNLFFRSLFSFHLVSKLLVLFLLLFILTFPVVVPLTRDYLSPQGDNLVQQTIRSSEDILAYGARPWDYFLPSIYHPLYGRYVEPLYEWIKEAGNDFEYVSASLPERVNYIPLVACSLSLVAVFAMLRWKDSFGREILTWILTTFWMFLVSMPGYWTFKGVTVYFPSYFLYKLLPMFRVYSRVGIFVLLGVAVLAAYGYRYIYQRARHPYQKGLLVLSVLLILFLETLNYPPDHVTNISQVPPVYQWLKEQPLGTLFVEYPKDMDLGGGCTSNVDPWVRKDFTPTASFIYQRYHHQPLFGHEVIPQEEQKALAYLEDKQSWLVLSKYGVRYVLVHARDPFPKFNPLDKCQTRRYYDTPPESIYPGFELVGEWEGVTVYRVSDK